MIFRWAVAVLAASLALKVPGLSLTSLPCRNHYRVFAYQCRSCYLSPSLTFGSQVLTPELSEAITWPLLRLHKHYKAIGWTISSAMKLLVKKSLCVIG